MLIAGSIVKQGDVVRAEPPRGAAVLDRNDARWMRIDLMHRLVVTRQPDALSSGGTWVSDSYAEVRGWTQLVERHGPLRLSR